MKHAIFIFLSLAFSCLPIISLATPAKAEQKEVSNILELCEAFNEKGLWLDDSGNCDNFSTSQTSLNTSRYLVFNEAMILKNLEIKYSGNLTPIKIQENGSLVINGGYYSSSNCFIWIQYYLGTKQYVSNTSPTIYSGTFEANLSRETSKYAPSPVCVVDDGKMTKEDVKEAIINFLPTSYHFQDTVSGTDLTEIPDEYIKKGKMNIDKNSDNYNDIWYLDMLIVSVMPDEEGSTGLEGATEKQETGKEEEIENPNTLDTGLLRYVVIFTISAVVLFTTINREEKLFNTYKKHKQ